MFARLETSSESAVQMHFSLQGSRTNAIMRTLTVLTAIFLPLNLITGVFGMNFDALPLIHASRWLLAGLRPDGPGGGDAGAGGSGATAIWAIDAGDCAARLHQHLARQAQVVPGQGLVGR